MEILVVALVAVGFWLVWRANTANDKINTTVVADTKPAVSEVEQRLWEQSVANVGKDEVKVLLTPEEAPSDKPAKAKKAPAKKPAAAKKAPAKKPAAKKTPAKKTTK